MCEHKCRSCGCKSTKLCIGEVDFSNESLIGLNGRKYPLGCVHLCC